MVSKIHQGDCLDVLKTMKDASVDSLVTDPPAGISFMGKSWDSDKGGRKQWISWMTDVMTECHRVMKPGAHGLIWALPRTSHWTATALEDAGFEIRDVVTHLFGSGFPKSLDISKAIDKAADVKGEPYIDEQFLRRNPSDNSDGVFESGLKDGTQGAVRFKPATDEAKQWQGWGTALKPASEHWILVRKPCSEKTVAKNVLKHGCGGLNIDASRVEAADQDKLAKNWDRESITNIKGGNYSNGEACGLENSYSAPSGRFPANLVLSHAEHCTDSQCDIECAVKMLDEQSGTSITRPHRTRPHGNENNSGWKNSSAGENFTSLSDSGGASRFFYCAKISTRERNAGCEDIGDKRRSDARPNSGDQTGKFPDHDNRVRSGNHHPTVKPQKLMRYLIKMITPHGGVVLDPFMGSGSTGCAAKSEGFEFIGIEREPEYAAIAEKRIQATA